MIKRWMMLAGVGLVAVLLICVVAVPAFAQSSTPTPTTPNAQSSGGKGLGFCFGAGGSWDVFDAEAKALGLTPEQFFSELHSGKTVEDIAKEKSVDLQTVQDAAKAAQTAAQKSAIEQAVKDGKLTQEQADWMLKGIDLGFMPMGRGRGRGFGFGSGGQKPSGNSSGSATPSVAPTTSS